MTHFTINGKPMVFHLVGLNDNDFNAYTAFIEAGGGKITDDGTECTVKFTKKNKYQPHAYETAAYYDVEFIRKCNYAKTLVDPSKYRLGNHESRDRCVMAHFLYGCHTCKEELSPTTQQQEPKMEMGESTGDEFFSPSQQPSLSSQFFSAQNSDLLNNADDETLVANNPAIDSHSVDESQDVITKRDIRKYIPVMAGGDIAENNTDGTNNTNEKRPCSLEYQVKVKPKMQELAEQQRRNLEKSPIARASLREDADHRPRRSTRTMTKRRRVMNGTPERDCPIKIETPDDTKDPLITENIQSPRNPEEESNARTSPNDISPKSEPISDPSYASDNETSRKKPRLTVIPEAHQRYIDPSYVAEHKKPKENWIESKNSKIMSPATKNGVGQNHEEENYIRPFSLLNHGRGLTVLNPLHKTANNRSSDRKNAESETRRTDLLISTENNEKRLNGNVSPETLREISNVAKISNRSRQLLNHEDNPLKTNFRVQNTSNELPISKREQKIVQQKKSIHRNNEEEWDDSSASNCSELSEVESVPEDVCEHRGLRNRKDDSSWNKPGPSGLASKRDKHDDNDNGSRKANGLKEHTENGRIMRSSSRSKRVPVISESPESDDDDDVDAERMQDNKRKTRRLIDKLDKSPTRRSKCKIGPYRKPFILGEKRQMIQYLIDNDEIERAKGYEIWKKMIREGHMTYRTYESLQNNMKRHILPSIETFGLDEKTLERFLKLREKRKNRH